MKNYEEMNRAELQEELGKLRAAGSAKVAGDLERLVQELRIHQVELEMQNRELREAQEELEFSRHRYADLYDFAPVGYVTLDDAGVITDANITAAVLLGRERTRLIGKPFAIFIEGDGPTFRRHLELCKESGEIITTRMTLKTDARGTAKVELISEYVKDVPSGTGLCRTAVVDITERARIESELRETRDFLNNLLDYANAPILVWDSDLRVSRVNHAFERLTGYAASVVVGKELDGLFPEDRKGEALACVRRATQGEHWDNLELPLLTRDGETRLLLWSSATIYDEAGTVVLATIAQGQDITERKLYEVKLEEKSKQLSEFFQIASHELNLPITIIKGYIQTLSERMPALSPEAIEPMLDAVERSADRLHHLVEDLLDVSHIEQGCIDILRESLDPDEFLRATATELDFMHKGRELTVTVERDVGRVMGDPERIHQVLAILVENAAKFSPPDSPIEVEAHREAAEVIVCVSDRGKGVLEEDRERIFERFFQGESMEHHGSSGLGLGLHIATEIAKAHGMRLWYEPREGGGSSFCFTLPVA